MTTIKSCKSLFTQDMILQTHPIQKTPTVAWEALPADFILPKDPVENIQEPRLAAALTQ